MVELVEGTSLENWRRFALSVGSNPTLSAIYHFSGLTNSALGEVPKRPKGRLC